MYDRVNRLYFQMSDVVLVCCGVAIHKKKRPLKVIEQFF